MRVNVDINLDKDAFHNSETPVGYPPKLTLHKISYINFCKLAQLMKKLIILGRLCFPLT